MDLALAFDYISEGKIAGIIMLVIHFEIYYVNRLKCFYVVLCYANWLKTPVLF